MSSIFDIEGLDKNEVADEARKVIDRHSGGIVEASKAWLNPDAGPIALEELRAIEIELGDCEVRLLLADELQRPGILREQANILDTKDELLRIRQLAADWNSREGRSKVLDIGGAILKGLAPIALEAGKAVVKAKLGG